MPYDAGKPMNHLLKTGVTYVQYTVSEHITHPNMRLLGAHVRRKYIDTQRGVSPGVYGTLDQGFSAAMRDMTNCPTFSYPSRPSPNASISSGMIGLPMKTRTLPLRTRCAPFGNAAKLPST